jgi:hypothetical protein
MIFLWNINEYFKNRIGVDEMSKLQFIKKINLIGGRVSMFKYNIDYFDMFDVKLLTMLSRPLKVDVHGCFHSIDTDLM